MPKRRIGWAALRDKLHPDVGRELISIDLDYVDLSDVPLDSATFPPSKLPGGYGRREELPRFHPDAW